MVQGGFKYFCPLKSPKFHFSMRIKQLQYIYIFLSGETLQMSHLPQETIHRFVFIDKLEKRIIISGGGGGGS